MNNEDNYTVGGFNNWTEKDSEKDIEMNNLNIDEDMEADNSKYRNKSFILRSNWSGVVGS